MGAIIMLFLLIMTGLLVPLLTLILQVGILITIFICILAFNGFEAIYLWYCDKPYSEGWFIVGWFVIAFLALSIFKHIRR